jgi:hypothetical protein
MTYTVSVRHVDTCLPCYVLDHCNGDDECLLGVPVSRADRVHHVKAALISEARQTFDTFPDDLPESAIESAIVEAWEGAHPLKAWDRSLDRDTGAEDGESVYSYFRFSWTREEPETGPECDTFEAPAHWAPYLINGDASGLDDGESDRIAAYLAQELPAGAHVVSCADESRFTWSYRLFGGDAEGGSVLEFTYLAPRAN